MLFKTSCHRSRRFYFEASPRISRPLAVFTCRAVPGDSYCSTLNSAMDARFRTAVLLFVGLSWACGSPAFGCRLQIPPHDQVARVARFVAHQCDWASMATISTHKPVVGQPFANVFSVSDGAPGTSSGVPYMYLTRMEISVQDLQVRMTCCMSGLSLTTALQSAMPFSPLHFQSCMDLSKSRNCRRFGKIIQSNAQYTRKRLKAGFSHVVWKCRKHYM